MSLNDIKAINWNKLEDPLDKEVWERMTLNFWLDTRFPLANDIPSWNTLTPTEKLVTTRVFVGLTLLDTAQSRIGAPALMDDAATDHEASNLAFITGMEAIHAKSYSSIFSTLLNTEEINDAFRWSEENPYLQKKKKLVLEQYNGTDPLKKKITSVFLESFLFYSGFYLPFYWGSKAKLTNTRDIIRSILADEALTANHELLTPNGWKNIAEITKDDLVAQYHPYDKKLEFVNPEIVSSYFENEVVSYTTKDGRVNIECSKNHRLLVEAKDGLSVIYKPKVLIASEFLSDKFTKDYRIIAPKQSVGANSKNIQELVNAYNEVFDELDTAVEATYLTKNTLPAQQVYCVQVPSTFLITRCKNSVTVTGNCIHGYYIGYKFQQLFKDLSEEKQIEYKDFTYNLLQELYDNEIKYTEELYDNLGLTEDVKAYIHYNANKALANLGFEPLFPEDLCEVNPVILASLSVEGESHDFFSGAGSSYVIGKVENTEDSDWDF